MVIPAQPALRVAGVALRLLAIVIAAYLGSLFMKTVELAMCLATHHKPPAWVNATALESPPSRGSISAN